VHWILEGKKSF